MFGRGLAALGIALVAGCHLMSGVDRFEIVVDDGGAGGAAAGTSVTSATTASSTASTSSSTASGTGGSQGHCDPETCPGGDTDCRERVCVGEQCSFADAAEGAVCNETNGKACDGLGSCVECVGNQHCDVGYTCHLHVCNSPGCGDLVQNQSETDVDCGGPNCSPCIVGKKCGAPIDCVTQLCVGGLCKACTVDDDCGAGRYCTPGDGTCHDKKGFGAGCAADNECNSGNCLSLVFFCGL